MLGACRGPEVTEQETLVPSPKSQAALKAAGPRVTIVKGERRNEAARRKVADVPVHDGLPGSLVSRLSARRVNQVHCVQSLGERRIHFGHGHAAKGPR